jgi:aspartate aminotransferase
LFAGEIAEIAAVIRGNRMFPCPTTCGIQVRLAQPRPLPNAPDLKDRTLTVSAFKPRHDCWRIGFASGPRALVKAMTVMQTHRGCRLLTGRSGSALDTPGAVSTLIEHQRAAISGRYAERAEASAATSRRRLVFPNVAGCLGKTTTGGRKLNTDEDVCLALMEENYVATVHGAAYFMSPFLRISTATADDELLEGLKRIQTFCEGLSD